MDWGDVYVRLGPRGGSRECELTLRWHDSNGELAERSSTEALERVDRVSDHPARILCDRIAALMTEVGGIRPGAGPINVLLDIQAPDLFAFEWERELPLRPPMFPYTPILRFRDETDERLLQRYDHPARVFHAALRSNQQGLVPTSAFRYYRVQQVSNMSDADVLDTLDGGRFDIVYFQVAARWNSDGTAEVSIDPQDGASTMSPSGLARALRKCGARFLMLDVNGPSDFGAALDVAHRLQRSRGPTTAVFEHASPESLDSLYLNIVHNSELGWATQSAMGPARQAFFTGIGGASVLDVAGLGSQVSKQVANNAVAFDELQSTLQRVSLRGAPIPGRDAEMARLSTELRGRAETIYDYTRESGGWVPLAKDLRSLAEIRRTITSLQQAYARVVNVGMRHDGKPLPRGAALEPKGTYELTVQIGRPSQLTWVEGSVPIPEAELERHYVDDGVDLRVVVFATNFEIREREQTLRLPRPPEESRELSVAMVAPKYPGLYRIRVCVYHANNLLQSVLLRVEVGPADKAARSTGPVGAEVEFALSASLDDPQSLPPRVINILANAGDDGTHTFVVVGKNISRQFDFSDTEMQAAVKEARKALDAIAADAAVRPPKYRFDADNRTEVARFEQDIIGLADLGAELFTKLVTCHDRDFMNELRAALGLAGATIQISVTKSAQYVFPWTLVYDRPLVGGKLALCPQFKADLQAKVSLSGQQCLTRGCAHSRDDSVVCPSGFWGYKHLVEQPLSVDTKANPNGRTDLVLELNAGPGAGNLPVLMAVSRELEQTGAHERELKGLRGFDWLVKDTKAETYLYMRSAAQAGIKLIYFYCHGGRDGSRVWLGLGKGAPERLKARELTEIEWTAVHPLVFINGCHTVDVSPDDVLNFNRTLAWCRAAGVIGTEISIPESLARDFARGFFDRFGQGDDVGKAMQERRLSLLARGNLLGLAYTPYCSTNLHIVRH